MILAHTFESVAQPAIIMAIFGLFYAWLVGVQAYGIGVLLRVIDYPDMSGGRKRHAEPTPLVGGVAIIPISLAAIAVTLILLDIPSGDVIRTLLSIIGLVSVLFFVGFIDDRHNLSPRLRLLLSLFVFWLATVTCPDLTLQPISFASFGVPVLLSSAVGSVLAMLCYVGFLNAINMADGKNGLVIGMCLIWSIFLLFYASAALVPVLLTLIIALGTTLWFNLRGRLFLGDSGAYGLSALLGLLFVYVYNQRAGGLGADQIITWLAIPVLDCLRLVITRLLSGRSPFQGDREHLHHYFARSVGWDRGKYIYWALVAIPGLLAIIWPKATIFWLGTMVSLYAAFVFIMQKQVDPLS
jgi:UDP-GlcNAc:undecaprenyl-phosphate/decaprenyl-phosphate GlcNAc-1-phosphate transferase